MSPSRWAWRRWSTFPLNGTQVCGRVNPNAGARDGAPLRLAADLNNMHLIDDASGRVI